MRLRVGLDLYPLWKLEVSWVWFVTIKGMMGFSLIAYPLTMLTQNKAKFIWSKACETSFQEQKDILNVFHVLTLPEGTDNFVVHCDALRIF